MDVQVLALEPALALALDHVMVAQAVEVAVQVHVMASAQGVQVVLARV